MTIKFFVIFSSTGICATAGAILVDDFVSILAFHNQLDSKVVGRGAEIALADVQNAVLASPAAAELEVLIGCIRFVRHIGMRLNGYCLGV